MDSIDNSSSADFGYQKVELKDKQAKVDQVFHAVARRYDLMNDVMSAGMHRIWKDAFVNWLAPPRGDRDYHVLDVAGGSGDIALRIAARAGSGTQIRVCDINADMLGEAQARIQQSDYLKKIQLIQANGEHLPFANKAFDAYSIAFGIRNIPRINEALNEAYRVLKPGGRLMILEFSQVEIPWLDRLYDAYSFGAIPVLGEWVTGDGDAYRYLVESIRRFPSPGRLSRMITESGFSHVKYRLFSGGVVAIHSAWRI